MAVRESENRRVGRNPEKLLTLQEAARQLGIPADDVEALVRAGKLPAFRLGGSLLRVRFQDIQAIQSSLSNRPHISDPQASNPELMDSHPQRDRWLDFFYYNDFYLIAFLVILTLLALIFTL